MEKFLSCDWGITSFRLRTVETKGFVISAEEKSEQGISKSFEAWKQSGKPERDRVAFYLAIIDEHAKALQKKTESALNKLPLIISGMASSSMGIIDLPYKEMPFSVDGADLEIKVIESDNFFGNTIIISGARTNNDVMRGEETQLVGCSHNSGKEETIYIFPGTHSKHIHVKEGKATHLSTYMTGEFFELLSQKSVLSTSVKESEDLHFEKHPASFEQGVKDSKEMNLLQGCFRVRTNDLLGKYTAHENHFYLSGLLIGTEMAELLSKGYSKITLVSGGKLSNYYRSAFNVLNSTRSTLEVQDADEAVAKGQYKIYEKALANK